MNAFTSALLLLSLCTAQAAAQKVNRCIGADGSSIFSDRRCEDMGALNRVPPPDALAKPNAAEKGASGPAPAQCIRRLSALAQQIRTAVDSHDANHLSALYWWSGVSDVSAELTLDRLDTIARRPLLAIVPVVAETTATTRSATTTAATGSDPQMRATGLRLQQTLGDHATPATTVLDLRRQYGCFWISF